MSRVSGRKRTIGEAGTVKRCEAEASGSTHIEFYRVGRRRILTVVRGGAALLAGSFLTWPLTAMQSLADEGTRITIHLPPVYKDGNSVPLAIEVASPMNASDYVRELHIVAPSNPLPEIARFRFTPLSGRAGVATRIRLDAGMQSVEVTAILSDGSVRTATARTQVAVGGCST